MPRTEVWKEMEEAVIIVSRSTNINILEMQPDVGII